METIQQAQGEVDSQQNTSNTKLSSLPWLVSLVDLTFWIKVRRHALNRMTRKAWFRGNTEPASREAAIERDLNELFCDHIFASDILHLEKKADVVLVLEGQDGSLLGLTERRLRTTCDTLYLTSLGA